MTNICARRFLTSDRTLPEVDKVSEKVGIFVDVQNIYYTCRDRYSRQFNYKALMEKIAISKCTLSNLNNT